MLKTLYHILWIGILLWLYTDTFWNPTADGQIVQMILVFVLVISFLIVRYRIRKQGWEKESEIKPTALKSFLAYNSYRIVHLVSILLVAGVCLLKIAMQIPIPSYFGELCCLAIGAYAGYWIAFGANRYLSRYPYRKVTTQPERNDPDQKPKEG